MKTLIIYAHPKTKGHCPLILRETEKILNKKKIKYDLLDLYKIEYDPVMHENEHYTSGNYEISKENKKIQEMIHNHHKIIFIYPIWWGSMPAILKGFFDKVLTPRFAFKFIGKIPLGLLKGKKAIVMATCGAPSFYYKLFYKGPIWLIKKGILGYCGIKTKVNFLGNSTKLTDKRKEKIKNFVKKSLKNI